MVLSACPQEDVQVCVNWPWAVSSREMELAGWRVERRGSNIPLVPGGAAKHLPYKIQGSGRNQALLCPALGLIPAQPWCGVLHPLGQATAYGAQWCPRWGAGGDGISSLGLG